MKSCLPAENTKKANTENRNTTKSVVNNTMCKNVPRIRCHTRKREKKCTYCVREHVCLGYIQCSLGIKVFKMIFIKEETRANKKKVVKCFPQKLLDI